MASKRSPESRVIDYFQDTPLDIAVTVLNIVKGNVKRRLDLKTPTTTSVTRKVVRKRRKVNSTDSDSPAALAN